MCQIYIVSNLYMTPIFTFIFYFSLMWYILLAKAPSYQKYPMQHINLTIQYLSPIPIQRAKIKE